MSNEVRMTLQGGNGGLTSVSSHNRHCCSGRMCYGSGSCTSHGQGSGFVSDAAAMSGGWAEATTIAGHSSCVLRARLFIPAQNCAATRGQCASRQHTSTTTQVAAQRQEASVLTERLQAAAVREDGLRTAAAAAQARAVALETELGTLRVRLMAAVT